MTRRPDDRDSAGGHSFWGVCYEGRGDPEIAAMAWTQALEQQGLTVGRDDAARAIRLRAVQRAGWLACLWRALLQRAEVEVCWDEDKALRVSSDFHLFRVVAVVGAVWALFVFACLAAAISFPDWVPESMLPVSYSWGFGLAVVGAVGAFTVVYLLGPAGCNRRSVGLWQSVIRAVESDGGFLQPAARDLCLRCAVPMVLWALAILGLGIWALGFHFPLGAQPMAPAAFAFNVLLFLAAVCLLSTAAVLLLQPGSATRVNALLTGLGSMVAALVFISGLPVLLLAAHLDPEEMAARMARPEPPELSQLDSAAAESAVKRFEARMQRHEALRLDLRRRSQAVVVFLALALVLGLGLFTYGIYAATLGQYSLWRTHRHRGQDAYRQAIGSSQLVAQLQIGFFGLWFFGLVAQGAGWFLLLLNAAGPWLPVDLGGMADLVGVLAGLLSSSLGLAYDYGPIRLATQLLWWAYCALALCLLAISIGQWWIERRVLQRGLETSARGSAEHEEKIMPVRERLAALVRRSRLASVELLCHDDRAPAFATRFRGKPTIVLKPVLFELVAVGHLEEDELDALLAHELAHLEMGHPGKLDLLRGLGRTTFSGDGFVTAMLHTFGFELAADRRARELGADPAALKTCLKKLQVFGSSDRLAPPDPSKMRFSDRWRFGLRLFREQYFRGGATSYWHPDPEHRFAALVDSARDDPAPR